MVRFRGEREGGGTVIGAAPSISSGKRSIDQCTDLRGARVPVTAAPVHVAAIPGLWAVWRIGSMKASGIAKWSRLMWGTMYARPGSRTMASTWHFTCRD